MFRTGCRQLLLQTQRRSAALVPVGSSVNQLAWYPSSSSPPQLSSSRLFSEQATIKEEVPVADTVAAATAAQAKKLVDVKKQLWEFYLSTGRGANALFESLDLDENGSIDPEELKIFMIQVMGDEDPKEVMPYAWNRLEQRAAAGIQYDIKHFKKWLVAATKMSADMKNSRMMAFIMQNPSSGDHFHNKMPYQGLDSYDEESPAKYTWNEETMSQSLRRMQYAVRGEVSVSLLQPNKQTGGFLVIIESEVGILCLLSLALTLVFVLLNTHQ
jgi:hypothetical protein